MVKADLARIVYERHGGITFKEAQQIVDLMIQEIKDRLLAGENVKLSGFGSLNVIDRKPRMGRNPQTGERIQLAASRYVTFRPSRAVKSEVQS
ncbi:MAG TPA: integration host factor subunit alpha [Acidobacteriota bacterium]|nr:integration host factor subunit alpha [Acidobacteriota bacterium]